jgi:vacuolar protein sorting-associated protein 45
VTLSCQISEQIEKGVLFEVSRVEQDLICQDNRGNNIEGVWKVLKNEKIEYYLKCKLVLLYSVKYPNDREIKEFQKHLAEINSDQTMLGLINLIGEYQIGHKSDLFHINSIKKKAKSYFDRMMKDVPNVYTQHKPYLF